MPKTRRNSSRARKKASLQRAVTEKTNKRMTSSVDEVERAWHFLKPLIVLLGTGLIGQITLYVEGNPTGGVPGGDPSTILDTGFVATKSSHQVLANNPFLNDLCALANSILVVAALVYAVYVALWVGDFGLAFRLLSCQFFRAYCGWFTYLPPSPEFLQSNYDVPEIFSSGAFGELLRGRFPVTMVNNEVGLLPFVSFFSGHVANIVIAANHMYINGFQRMGLIFHVLNCLQVYRLLATRGHYSIDIIVGFVVAVHVTNPAERLGLYFSSVSRQDFVNGKGDDGKKFFIKYFESLIDIQNNTFTSLRKSNPIQKPPLREFAENLEESYSKFVAANVPKQKIIDLFSKSYNETPQAIKKRFESINGSFNEMMEQLKEQHERNMRSLEDKYNELKNSTS